MDGGGIYRLENDVGRWETAVYSITHLKASATWSNGIPGHEDIYWKMLSMIDKKKYPSSYQWSSV